VLVEKRHRDVLAMLKKTK